jgi:hypothetical protein
LRVYFRLAQTSGGFLTWWNRLFPGKARLRSICAEWLAASLDVSRLLAETLGRSRHPKTSPT